MSKKGTFIILLIIATISVGFYQFGKPANEDDRFVSYIVNPKKQNLEFFWKNKKEEHFKNAENLISWLKSKNKKLLFSTNGGMYKKDNSPQGLYVENTITKSEIDTSNGKGNFYLKPNGVFYLTTDKNPMICKTENFLNNEKICNYRNIRTTN